VLGRLEALIDASGVPGRIEALLPVGPRPRQLPVRSLLIAMVATQVGHRPAHLTRVHNALVSLGRDDQRRLGVLSSWKAGPHLLTYRQTEYTFGLVAKALAKKGPDGQPSELLGRVCDQLLEASIPQAHKEASLDLAVDWSDHEAFSCPPAVEGGPCADPEASWGRRKSNQPGRRDELFFGYEVQAATMVRKDNGPEVPELVRRMLLTTASVDPPRAFVAVLQGMAGSGIALGDILVDSGYSHRIADHFASPLRRLGAGLVMDLHPSDRGPKGTFGGAICCNGNLYCPATPRALMELVPLARGATAGQVAAHDQMTAELSRYKLARVSANDGDGYHRLACPAVTGKLRCPVRPDSMALSHQRPEVLFPPGGQPLCCTQQTLTVPPAVNAKTAQKYDYPSRAHRRSYARRTGVERTFSTTKDRASNDLTRGWCRLMGLSAIMVFIAASYVARNLRVADAFDARQAEDARRVAAGREPKKRKRRRQVPDEGAGPTAPDASP